MRRIVVTQDQISRYGLSDDRDLEGKDRVQVEALEPSQLASEVDAAVRNWIDLGKLREIQKRGEEERAELVAAVEQLMEGDE